MHMNCIHNGPRGGRALLGGAALVALAIAMPGVAAAQDSGDAAASTGQAQGSDVDLIVVTGSRIPRAEFESLQPVTVVDSANIELRAAFNVADILNEQPVFALPGNSPIGTQTGATVGQNFVNIFGLGDQRTLTLVNGQRFPAGLSPASGSGGVQVDLNAIPTGLIERVETIAIGGAPIYGTDAIAGTVNVILRDDFDGLEYTGSFGISPEYGDGKEYNLGAVWGTNFHNGRGNIAISGEYTNIEGLFETDREVTELGLAVAADDSLQVDPTVVVDSNDGGPLFFADSACFNTVCFNDFTAVAIGLEGGFFFRPNGIPLDINDQNSPITQFDADGNLVPFIPGEGDDLIFRAGGDGLDLNELSALYTDSERFNANLFFNYELTNNIRFNAEGWFGRTEATELVNQPFYNSPAFGGVPANGWGDVAGGSIPVVISNPFIPDATRDIILAALNDVHDVDEDGLAEPTIDTDGDGVFDAVGFGRFGGLGALVGDNPNSSKRDTYRAVFGLEGDLLFGGDNFAWDLTYAYGRTESDDTSTEINQGNFDLAIQVVDDGAGNPVCFDPSNGCIPLNLFGQPTPEAVDYVVDIVTDRVVIEQNVFTANIGGEPFELPAGPVGAAIGFQYRSEKASYDPNDLAENGLTRTALVPVDGDYNTKEVYAEVVVPLLGGDLDTPFVDALDFEGAVRLVDNSVAGTDPTYTMGGRYRVSPEIEFRGNFTRSIRAPSITELFTPTTQLADFSNDPCDSRFIGEGNFPDRRAANCAAEGIPDGFQSIVVNASQLGTLAGNPNLSVETADSFTYGVIVQPRVIEGLSVAVDWLDIEITDAIASLTLQEIMQGCYDSADFPNEPLCALFQRDAGNQVLGFQSGFNNIDSIEFAGLQSVATYNVPYDRWGDLSLRVGYLYTDENIVTRGENNPNDTAGDIGESQHRVTASATFANGPWTVFGQGRYLSEGVLPDTPYSAGAWTVFDAALAYELNEKMRFQLAVDNLLDRDAPLITPASGDAIQTYFSGIQGRYVTFSVRGRF